MDIFPFEQYCPTYRGPNVTAENRFNVAQFGDGYRQVVPDGINTSLDSYSVDWNNIAQAAMLDIWGFLQPRQNGTPFLFQLPDMDSPVAVYCVSVSKKQNLHDLWSISATLKRTAAIG